MAKTWAARLVQELFVAQKLKGLNHNSVAELR